MTRAQHPLPLRTAADTTDDVQRVLSKLEESGKDLRIIRLVANSKNVFRPFVLMADALLARATLDAVTREVIVLYLAARQGERYEWAEHAPMARAAGVTEEQIASIRDLSAFEQPLFDEQAIAARRFVDALLDHNEGLAALWDETAETLGVDALLDLVFSVAWWGGFVPVATRALLPAATDSEERASTTGS